MMPLRVPGVRLRNGTSTSPCRCREHHGACSSPGSEARSSMTRVPSRAYRVTRVTLTHRHLVGTLVAAGGDHRKRVADRPERQQSDPELALNAVSGPFRLQSPLDRIADMRRDVFEVRPARLIAGH